MKIAFFFICLVVFQINTLAQDWIKYYGQEQNAECRNIVGDYDKGILIGGTIKNYTYIWIVKCNINGEMLWSKRIGNGVYSCGIGNIEKTQDGGCIICGTWQKVNPNMDAFIIKLNACAEIEWCKTLYSQNNYDLGWKIKPTPDGGYVLLSFYNNTNPYSRTSLFKFSGTGDLIWHQFYPLESTYNNDEAYDLLVDSDGYIVLTSRYHPNPGTTIPAIERHHLFKTDTAGNLQWDLVYGADTYYYGGPWSLMKNNTGAYYEAGRHLQQSMAESSPAFIKLAPDGTPQYDADIMSNVYWGGLSSIDMLQDSLLVMVGGYSPDQSTSYDAFFKSDTLGNLRKTKIIQRASGSYWSACKTEDSKFVAVGNDFYNNSWRIVAVKVNSNLEYDSIYTQPFTYDSLCPHPIVSDTIDPNCDNVIVSVDEPFKKPETTQLKVYPNPANDKITVELPKYLIITDNKGSMPVTTVYHQWQKVVLQAIDLNGKIVLNRELQNNNETVQIDVSRWSSGSYLFRMIYNGKQVAGSKVVVK
ncbi:MAG: T9SS type A sorting domain-containing protein [Bacteroidales bacterium]